MNRLYYPKKSNTVKFACIFKLATVLFYASTLNGYSQSDYSLQNLQPELTSKANSVILEEDIVVDVSDEKKKIVTYHKVITVLNKKGNHHLDAYIHYDDDVRLKEVKGTIYDKKGSIIKKFKRKDFNDLSATDGVSLYNSSRILFLEYTPISYPYTFEFNYTLESRTTAFIMDWMPIKRYRQSTQQSNFQLIYNPSNKPRYSANNLDQFGVVFTETPNSYTFKLENLEPVKYEKYSPEFRSLTPNVSFALDRFYLQGVYGVGRNWKEFGSWMNNSLIRGTDQLPEATIEMAKSLVKNENSDLEKSEKNL